MSFRSLASFCSISLLALAAAACGSDETETKQPAANKATVNTAQAKEAAKQAIAASLSAVKDNNGQTAANQLQSAASQMQGVITPAGGAGAAPAAAGGALAAGTCSCDASQCTFQDCGDPNGTTINGTMSWSGGHVLCDLTYHVANNGGYTLDLATTCDLTVTDTSIDGTLGSSGSLDGSAGAGEGQTGGMSYSYSWTTSTAYNAVTFNGSGTPTGGSIDVSGTYEVGGQSYEGSATIAFP
jgi:hypothetical protein